MPPPRAAAPQFPKYPVDEDYARFVLTVYLPGEWQDADDLKALSRYGRSRPDADEDATAPDGGRLGRRRYEVPFATYGAALVEWFHMGRAERAARRLPPFPRYERALLVAARESKKLKESQKKGKKPRRVGEDDLPTFEDNSHVGGASPESDDDDAGTRNGGNADIAGAMRGALAHARVAAEGDADDHDTLLAMFKSHAGAAEVDWSAGVGVPLPTAGDLCARRAAANEFGDTVTTGGDNPLNLTADRAWQAVGKQRVAVAAYVHSLLDDTELRLGVFGCGGAGKSYVQKTISNLGRKFVADRGAVLNTALASSAARLNPDGRTFQSLVPECPPPRVPKNRRRDAQFADYPCSARGLQNFQDKLRLRGDGVADVTLFNDETSMLGGRELGGGHYRCCEGTTLAGGVVDASRLFGKVRRFLFSADFAQLAPVGQPYLREPLTQTDAAYTAMGAVGHAVFEQLLTEGLVVLLDRNMRQDPRERKLRERTAAVRCGRVTEAMAASINARALSALPPSERADFTTRLDSIDVLCSNKRVFVKNVGKTLRLGQPVAAFRARGSGSCWPSKFQLQEAPFGCCGAVMVCTANFQGDEQPPIVKAQVSAATFAVAQSPTVTVRRAARARRPNRRSFGERVMSGLSQSDASGLHDTPRAPRLRSETARRASAKASRMRPASVRGCPACGRGSSSKCRATSARRSSTTSTRRTSSSARSSAAATSTTSRAAAAASTGPSSMRRTTTRCKASSSARRRRSSATRRTWATAPSTARPATRTAASMCSCRA